MSNLLKILIPTEKVAIAAQKILRSPTMKDLFLSKKNPLYLPNLKTLADKGVLGGVSKILGQGELNPRVAAYNSFTTPTVMQLFNGSAGNKPIWTQEYVNNLANYIKSINELQSTNFALPRLVQKEHPALDKFKQNPAMYKWMVNSLGVKPITYVEIPNIGLLKFRKGGRLVKRNKFSIK